ncbi:zf-HC2 domain-containing protein [Stieleria tagensis]|uniref:zf-HC2 domain-containing protein n=1 Tax=Stieleria tagensis TaxID=2956795 RepID=UPI00209AAB4E|nr:zf-HC2 domain-containing protein [Stieleria tagensis]
MQASPWSVIAAQLNDDQHPVVTRQPITQPDGLVRDNRKSSRARGILVIFAAIAASILILTWSQRRTEDLQPVAHSGHSHLGSKHIGSQFDGITAINFQDAVLLQQSDTLEAMRSLSTKYRGKEASVAQVVKDLGYKPSVASTLLDGAILVSTQLLQMPDCHCVEGECSCGPGECNCVACVCQRPDGSTFMVVEQCRGQDVNFGDLPVRRVQRGNRELHVSESDQGLAVTWNSGRSRMTAIGLRELQELDPLLAAN